MTGGDIVFLCTGAPFTGSQLKKLQSFLLACHLEYDPGIRFTAVMMEDDEIVATGSLDGCTIKCVAVSPAYQGEDLTAKILTVLMQEALSRGLTHLMLYTKPCNQYLFAGLGFHPVIRTADVLLMENRRGGLDIFLTCLKGAADDRTPVGCIVANANPFTLGHRHLVETSSCECAWVHLFILSEDRGMFSTADRMQMAREACADLPNVLVHPTGPYLVSSATFPSYFLKDQAQAPQVHCELDLRLFGERIAPRLGITRRYVGTEPLCPVTAQYNARMKALLPEYGVDVIEIGRAEAEDAPISASRVRELIRQADFDALAPLLPPTTLRIIREKSR